MVSIAKADMGCEVVTVSLVCVVVYYSRLLVTVGCVVFREGKENLLTRG